MQIKFEKKGYMKNLEWKKMKKKKNEIKNSRINGRNHENKIKNRENMMSKKNNNKT